MRYQAKTTKQTGLTIESVAVTIQPDVMPVDATKKDGSEVVASGPFKLGAYGRACYKSLCELLSASKRKHTQGQVLAAFLALSCIALDYSGRDWICHWYQLGQWPGVEAMGGGPLKLEGVINNENGQAVPGAQIQVGYCEPVPSTRHEMPGRIEREVWITADDQGRFKFEGLGIWARVKQVRFEDGFTLRPIQHVAANSQALPQMMTDFVLSGIEQTQSMNRPHLNPRTLQICDFKDQSHLHTHIPLVVYPFTKRAKHIEEAMILVRFDGDCQLEHSGLAHLHDLEVVK